MKILVTGAAGFIGFHLISRLSKLDFFIIGLDNINDYYNVDLKYSRLEQSGIEKKKIEYGELVQSNTLNNYSFIKLDLTDKERLFSLFMEMQFDYVCNLAAQAGVRYSLENPYAYIDSNINGFINILEASRNNGIKHLIYASSSSVYGNNKNVPFSVTDNVDNPISLYAATKKSNELMAYTYSHLFGIPCTGLRFFTVYGPWGRPDMAYFKFANLIMNNKPIEVYNYGNMLRDFTYIDDITDGIHCAIEHIPSDNLYEIYNLGNNKPVKLADFIITLEKYLEKKTEKKFITMQPGDVPVTIADIEKTRIKLGWEPKIDINKGLKQFTEWFLKY